MTIPFFRRKQREKSYKGIADRATFVDSAERAWPRLRNTRTLEENREAMERIRRYRAEAAQD
jgi:hypothetical protein